MYIADHNQAPAGFLVRLLSACALALAAVCMPRVASALDTGDIVVASVRGEVHFQVRGSDRQLKAGSVLELPATLRTGSNGAVELRQGATSVNVGPDTLLEFPATEVRGGPIDRIVQPRGNAFYDIGKRPGRKLRVETPLLVGVVKGTQFNVASGDDATTISLFEGLLEIRAADESSVVDIKAGEIAMRRRGDKDITIIKMDPGKAPPTQRPSSGADSNKPASPTPRPADDGESSLADGDARGEPPVVSVEIPGGLNTGMQVDVDAGATGLDTSVSTGVNAPGVAAMDVAVGASLGESTTVDAGLTSNVDLGAAAADVGVDTSVALGNGAASVDVATNVNVDLGSGAAALDTSVDVSVDVSNGSASVDAGTNLNVDLGGGAVAVDTTVDLGVDAVNGAANVDAGAAVNVDLGGTAAADAAVDAGVDVGTGTAAVDVGADVAVDLGGAPVADVAVDTGVDVGAGSANVDLGTDVAGVDAAVNAGVDVANGNVDLGLSLGGLDVDVGLDLGLDDAEGQDTDTGETSTPPSAPDPGDVVDGLLDGLFRRPGSR